MAGGWMAASSLARSGTAEFSHSSDRVRISSVGPQPSKVVLAKSCSRRCGTCDVLVLREARELRARAHPPPSAFASRPLLARVVAHAHGRTAEYRRRPDRPVPAGAHPAAAAKGPRERFRRVVPGIQGNLDHRDRFPPQPERQRAPCWFLPISARLEYGPAGHERNGKQNSMRDSAYCNLFASAYIADYALERMYPIDRRGPRWSRLPGLQDR